MYMPPHVWMSIDALVYSTKLGIPLDDGGCADDDLGPGYDGA